MKHINLIEWLQTDSHEKQSATRDHHGTKPRELPDNPRLYRYPCATLALPLRYVAMIFAVLVMSVANIGMAWGAESATNDPATVSYGTGGAAKTFLNVSNTVANCTISSGSVACVTYGLYEMDKNWKPAFYSGPANGSSSSYNYSGAASVGFMAGSSAGTGTAANKSATSGYGAAKYTSSASAVIYVTGVTGIAVMGKDNNTKDEKRLHITVEEYAADGTCTAVGTTKSSYSTSLHITTFDAGSLSGTKYYKVTLTSGNTSNCETSQIRFTKYIAPSCTNPTASWSTAPANGTAGGNMNASLTTNYAAGVVYTSSNTDVATVSGDGTATCAINYVAAGSARITATVTGDGSTICAGPATCYTDITVTAAGSGWGIASSDNSWTASADEMSGSGTVTKTLSLSANADLQFKIVDISGNTWYGNGEIWGGTKTQSVSSTGTANNCHLLTTEAGSYTFSFNTSTKDLTITYPNSYTFYYANTNNWSKVYVYKFTTNGSTGNNAAWPGTQIASPSYTCGGTDYYAATSDGYAKLIFTNNSGNQTGDMVVSSSDAGKYVGGTGSSWSAFPTYTVTYNKNGDGAGGAGSVTGSVPTDSNSPYACGSTVTVLGNTGSLALDGYTFAGWNTAPGGGGTSYAANATFTISANTTLYAQWEEDASYSVTYNANGATGSVPTDANTYANGEEVTVLGKNTLAKTNYGFAGWRTAVSSGTWYVQGQTFDMGSANVNLYAQWVAEASMVSGTLYKAVDMKASAASATGQYRAGISANGIFEVLGVGVVDATTGPMEYGSDSRNIDGTAFTEALHFKGTGSGSPSGSTLPTTRAIKFRVPAAGTLHLWVRAGSKIAIVKSGGSASAVGSSTDRTHETVAVTAGTYYLYATGTSVSLYGLQFVQSCTAPTGLTAASTTAKGTTFTITDGANTNDYEFYVVTSSGTPASNVTPTHITTNKTLTITDCIAGTTYYAWVRSKCGESNKSDWVALTGNTFTTSTVSVTLTLSNVTETSGAATSGVGGSDYTAVFAAVSGYSLPAPAITIDGNAAESGTDYTWTQGTGTVVIHANKITGNIVITIASAAAAPSSVAIGDNWLWFAGETMTLTATPTGGNGPVTYQWYKGGKADGNAIEGATNATFSKTCAFSDAGSYYCKVTCGGTESTWGKNGDAYDVKIPRLYVKTGRNDGVKSDYGNVDFTRVDASTATASISLGANWDYCFNIADGCGHYYGNAGTMQYNSYGPWVTNVNNQDCGLRTTNGATYVFTIDYSNWEQLKTTVTFPSSDQAAGKVIYFDNNDRQWSNLHYRIGRGDHTQAAAMTLVPGTANLYKYTTVAYDNFAGWHIANNSGWTGSNTIYRTYTNGDQYSITYATAHEGGAVTQAAVTVTPTTSRGAGSDAGINDNCNFYNYEITTGMKTQNVSITAPTNGTITVSYTDTENAAQSFTSGNADLAHTVIITPTVSPATGYQLSGLTVNGNAHTPGNTYTVTGTTVIAATFSLIDYTVTLNTNGGTINAGNVTSYNYGTGATLPTNVTKDGYTFDGWFDNSGLTGDAVTSIPSSATGNKEFWAKWTCVTPTITTNLSTSTVNYNVGDAATALSVAATAAGGSVSYQWYSNTANSTTTPTPTALTTGTSYTPSTAAAGTTYYFCVITNSTAGCSTTATSNITPVTVTAVAVQTALVANTLYEVPDMIPSGESLTSSDQFMAGLSENTKFEMIGVPASSSTPKVNNDSKNDKTIDGITFDDGSMWFKGNASLASNIPTTFGLSFIVPTGGGKLYLYFSDSGTSTNIKLAKSGSSGSKPTLTDGFAAVDVTAGTYYLYGTGTTSPYSFYGLKLVTCTTPAAPTGFANTAVTSTTATFSITDAADAASYDLYYASGSPSTPTAGTNATENVTTKTPTITGLTASTTYKIWARSVCDASHKSSWVALGTTSFTTSAAEPDPLVHWTMKINNSAWGTTATATTDGTNITSINTSRSGTATGTATSATVKVTMASAEVSDNSAPDNSANFTFTVNSAKKVVPEKVTCQVFNVSSGNRTYKAQISDSNGHVYNSTNTLAVSAEATLTDATFNFASDLVLTGDVTVKVYAWGSGSEFRMGQHVKLFGEVQNAADYTVTHTLSNVTKSAGATSVKEGNNYTATYAGAGGYALPSTITVTIGGSPATAGTDYTWTQGTGVVSIPGNKVTGNIVITVTGDEPAVTHNVTFSLTNVVYSSGNNQGTGAATEGSAFSTVFAASSGYSLPGTITVTIGGVEQTAGTGYTWAQGSGTLTIPAAYVTGDIVVTIVGEEMEGDGCDELVHTEAATATSLSTSVGTATLYNPSGQTANDKAIKLNSSGYIELSPKAGKSFAAGDSLIIVMWNQASSAKTTGYRIAGTDYTASMPSKVNTTFRRKLIAADIVSSKVKIERESANGSNAYFVSAIIKHCEDLPSCTTPTLPTLSNQTVCPGSDIAAWDATPTNIATITGASEDVAYSWKKKGSDTELAATASFDLGSSATEGMAGTYVVTVTVSKTGYISKSASAEVDLTVTPATETPSITASKAKVYATDEVTLTATCGSTGVTWNWYLCANSDGTGAGSSLGTSATYTIASAPAAGTYYYKAVATGDGTHSCGTAEYVYTLVVSAANSCDKEFWFAKEADRPTGAASATHITGCPSGSSSASYTASIDGTNYTLTGSTGQKTGNVTIVVPADNTGTLYVVVQGSSSRTITLSKGGTQIGQETPENSTWGVFTFDNLDAGTYNLVSSGNISWAMMALKLCPTVACTDDTPTAAATNATVCAGGSITITATGYETGATFQWQKQNASTSVWEDIDDATSDTYTVTTAAAEHAGNYHIVANKTCARTSNTVTIAVPSAPVFNSFTTTRRVMETQALSISDVSATDAVSYTWYKSADATWDAGDTEIGTSKNLLKPYDGETAGSTYYVFCRAMNSCGATTSSAITVTVQTLVEEDCAIVGNSGEHNTFAKTGSVSSGTYGSIAELHTNSNNKYIYYTAESGYYFATATVNACVGNASDLPTAAYSYSTDGGANWTDQNLTGMTTAYADHVINLPANVNAFRVGRRLGDCGISSNTIYIHQVCFTYNENCTKTTVDPSSSSVDYEIGDSFTEPTFTVKSSGVALSPQPTITYTSSDETVATVDDDGTVNFQDKAGTVVITAAYAGDATYCDSEGSYTITVSCSDEAPKIIAAAGTNIGGCNSSITLEAKKQDGTTNFSDGTYQWYRDGEAISGATDRTYTVSLTGVYSVERTSVGGCVSPSNKATVTSESAEPEVERLTPFQYYHVDKVYAETSIMRFRHLFAVKNAGTTLEGKHFKMELSRNGGAATDVTNSNAFVMSADTVLLDLNKMGDGKYEEDDELVLTCSAVDCEGNVSSIYKNTITIYVIDETPTLALICSGANGDGTRKTSNLVVGGDFLTGYNKADLCVQTGNTSFDKTQEWVLYTRLKENYIVTPVNGYAEFNKLNYEPFDILFLTDYPKASKSDAAATILDDMADLCDYRPLFTFKTHMVHKSPSKWAAKGFMAEPKVPEQSRLRLNIVCYAHPMFDDLKTTSTYIQKDASDHSQIVYTMLAGAGHEGGKGMQGFPIDAAEGFVTIGLVHNDATAADNTPSAGYVTWTPGSKDVMLVAAAERQVNLEARMILFSVNCGAQSKLTETGRQVVLKSLEYLLSDATIKPVADCSFTFTNGAGNDWTYEQYKAKCPACTGTIGDGKWSTAGNWGPDWILQPGKDTEVKIAAPVTVDMPHAKVRTVRILEGGSIDIPAGSGLEVGSTIRRLDGTEISPTEVADLSIGSTISGNGTLIFNNNAGDTKAGVAMYSKGFIDYTDPSKPKGIKNYQYIGVPFTAVNALYNYYGSWLYSWSDKGSGWGWQKVPNGGTVTAWTGYCITQETATTHWSTGTLAATNTVDIDVPAGENMVVGNSWTAPIYIKEFTDDDFENLPGNVYFFNTGVDQDYTSGHEQDLGDRYARSTYVTVPIHSSPYTGDSLISSMQGFFVKSNGSAGALHLDYDRHVRPSTNRNILSGQMHAPVRRANAQSDEPTVLKIKVSGENYDDKLLLLEREDFTEGFDNGWDGDKWDGNESALYIYTTDINGTENSVSAIPELEGTVIGFRAGEDEAYTLHFEYLNSAEELYLFDTETNAYTKIMTGATYRFFTNDNEKHDRFILTRKNPQVATGVGEVPSDQVLSTKAKKLLIEDKMFIMVNGMLYDATGKVVK